MPPGPGHTPAVVLKAEVMQTDDNPRFVVGSP